MCISGGGDILEDDETLVEQSIEGGLFEFLVTSVVAAKDFHSDVSHCVHRMFEVIIIMMIMIRIALKVQGLLTEM